ncbi:MAG: hypothetical protein GYA34_08410 [Chloroflexi bacterium]|nr:hypothetical protein [Chloroflexota bacterium]
MDERQRVLALRVVCGITALLFAAWVYSFALPAYDAGILFLSRRLIVKFILGLGSSLSAITVIVVTFSRSKAILWEWFDRIQRQLRRLNRYNYFIFALLVISISIFLMSPSGLIYRDKPSRLLLFWLLSLAGSILLKSGGLTHPRIVLLGGSAVFTAFGFKLAAYIPDVSTYPFTLSWSEASRYYYASLFFARKIYGEAIAPTILHPTRYLLQAIPFLLPNSTLWLHRLWQVLLWIGITLILSAVFARRLNIQDWFFRIAFTAWVFLFLLIGPIYYHLQVPVILVIWGFYPVQGKRRSMLISYVVLVIASIWAGISRVNWYPVPGMLASLLYFIEVNQRGKPFWRYLLPPAFWTIGGILTAMAAQVVYIRISGNPPDQFTSSFTSNLLWYRLFPNSTYPLGILGASVVVSLPLILLAIIQLGKVWRRVHIIRWLGIGAILLILFTGGLVVSVKIGGGSNLHNMDAYLATLLVICGMIHFGCLSPDLEESETAASLSSMKPSTSMHYCRWILIGCALLMPIAFTIFSGGALTYPDHALVKKSLEKIRSQVLKASQEGEVLFISERQLMIFGEILGVKLVPEYERVFLMEMAMSGNPDYLERFHQDLKNQRFAMIVTEPVYLPVKGEAERFGEENNAWVNTVGVNLRCYYTAIKTIKDVKVQLLVPQQKINKKCQ